MRCISSPPRKAPKAVPVPALHGTYAKHTGSFRGVRDCRFEKNLGALVGSFSSCQCWRAEGECRDFSQPVNPDIFVSNLFFSVNSVRCPEKTSNYCLSCYPGSKTAWEEKGLSVQESESICMFWAFSFSCEITINCAWRWNMEDDATLWNWI